MNTISTAAPDALYRSNRHDEALALADQIIADNPFAAEALMTRALILIRRQEGAQAIQTLRKCMGARSAEWVLERMRRDFVAQGQPAMGRDMVVRLGGFLRGQLGPLGPALAPTNRRATDEFVNLLGTSYVRSFGGSPVFLPIFLGMGPTTLLLTEDEAQVTRRKFREHLKRLDTTRNTVLVVGGDPYYHAVRLRDANAPRPDGPTAEDLNLMDKVAERHAGILADARAQLTGRVGLLATTPTPSQFVNALSRRLNAALAPVAQQAGVDLFDWWDEWADPATGLLREDYGANAYSGDIHFSIATTPIFLRLLKAAGYISPDASETCDFDWTHVFECNLDPSERTRIWCEPSVTPKNAVQSHKVAAAHLNGTVADLTTLLLAERQDQTLLVINVRDGFLPVAIPAQVHVGCLAITDTPQNHQVAQQVLDFFGRPDVRLETFGPTSAADGADFSRVVVLLHPDSFEADLERGKAMLARIQPAHSIIVATPHPERIPSFDLKGRSFLAFNISNRHIPEVWRDFSIAISR